jgi:hypothetical protein
VNVASHSGSENKNVILAAMKNFYCQQKVDKIYIED